MLNLFVPFFCLFMTCTAQPVIIQHIPLVEPTSFTIDTVKVGAVTENKKKPVYTNPRVGTLGGVGDIATSTATTTKTYRPQAQQKLSLFNSLTIGEKTDIAQRANPTNPPTILGEVERGARYRKFKTDKKDEYIIQIFTGDKYTKDQYDQWQEIDVQPETIIARLMKFVINVAYATAFPVSTGTDEGYEEPAAQTCSTAGGVAAGDMYWGYYGANDSTCPWMRYNSITIPAGSTINTATVTYDVTSNRGTAVAGKVYGEAADNCAAITSSRKPSGITKVASTVNWSVPASTGIKTSPDISTIITDIVGRGGWASGNSICLFFWNDGTWTNTDMLDYSPGYSTNTSNLTITYTEPAPAATPISDQFIIFN